MVKFVPAVAYHFCLSLPAAFTQPGDHLLAESYKWQPAIHQVSSILLRWLKAELEIILDIIKAYSHFRDIQIRKNVVARLEECETRLTEETKERQSGEKEVREKLEAQSQTLQSYMDNTADVIRKLTEVGRNREGGKRFA